MDLFDRLSSLSNVPIICLSGFQVVGPTLRIILVHPPKTRLEPSQVILKMKQDSRLKVAELSEYIMFLGARYGSCEHRISPRIVIH